MLPDFDFNANLLVELGIDFKQLIYFLVVVDQMSFSKAASVLYVSQSLLSQRISALEKSLGCQLLIRGHHALSLTPAGEVLVEKAIKLVDLMNDLTFSVHRAASQSQPKGKLVIAVENTLPDSLVTSSILAYKKEDRRIVFSILCRSLPEISRAVINGSADIGIMAVAAEKMETDMACQTIAADTLCLAVSKRLLHDYSLKEFIYIANRFPTVMLSGEHCCSKAALDIYEQMGIRTDFQFVTDMREVMMHIECGMGVGLLPERNLLAMPERNIMYYPLKGILAANIRIVACWKQDSSNKLIHDFVDCTERFLK